MSFANETPGLGQIALFAPARPHLSPEFSSPSPDYAAARSATPNVSQPPAPPPRVLITVPGQSTRSEHHTHVAPAPRAPGRSPDSPPATPADGGRVEHVTRRDDVRHGALALDTGIMGGVARRNSANQRYGCTAAALNEARRRGGAAAKRGGGRVENGPTGRSAARTAGRGRGAAVRGAWRRPGCLEPAVRRPPCSDAAFLAGRGPVAAAQVPLQRVFRLPRAPNAELGGGSRSPPAALTCQAVCGASKVEISWRTMWGPRTLSCVRVDAGQTTSLHVHPAAEHLCQRTYWTGHGVEGRVCEFTP